MNDPIKVPDREIIQPIPPSVSMMLDKKPLFQGEMNTDITNIPFHETQEQLVVPMVNYDISDLNSEPLFPFPFTIANSFIA